MKKLKITTFIVLVSSFIAAPPCRAAQISVADQPAQLDIRAAGQHSLRITLKPVTMPEDFPENPALADRDYAVPVISLREISAPVQGQVGPLKVEVRASPLRVIVTNDQGQSVQDILFDDQGTLTFETFFTEPQKLVNVRLKR